MRTIAKIIVTLFFLFLVFIFLILFVPVEPFKSCKSKIIGDEEVEEEDKDEEIKAIEEYLVGDWGVYCYIKEVEGKPKEVFYVGDNLDGSILKVNTYSINFGANGLHEYINRRGTVWYGNGEWRVQRNPNTQDIYVNLSDKNGTLYMAFTYVKEEHTLSSQTTNLSGAAVRYVHTTVFQKLS